MTKFEIALPEALAEFVTAKVEAGLYSSEADVIQDAVRRLLEADEVKLEALRAALAPGLADAEAGRFFDGTIDDIIAEARAEEATHK